MREILFRGKRIDNGEWVEGFLIFDREFYGKPDYHSYIVNHSHPSGCFGGDIYIEVDPSTVGQYTGLKDKNGKRIFEGDVIKTHSGIAGRIVFGNCYDDEYCFCANGWFFAGSDEAGDDCKLALTDEWSGHVVIGNIHDNPELMDAQC